MKLTFTFHTGDKSGESEIELQSLPPVKEKQGRLKAQSAGAPIEADWAEIAPRVYSILLNGRSFDVRLEWDPATHASGGALYIAHVGPRAYRMELRDPRRGRRSGAAGSHDGPQEIVAPMPGRIVKVLAAAGQQVKAGESLVVMEAMKMQNEIRAPRDARVETIRVTEGEGVETGALLLRLS